MPNHRLLMFSWYIILLGNNHNDGSQADSVPLFITYLFPQLVMNFAIIYLLSIKKHKS